MLGEVRSHEETRGKLAREEKAKNDAITEREQARTERDQSRKELADLRKENAEVKALHPILAFYGPRAKYTASFDLKKEANSQVRLDRCPGQPCIILTLTEITKEADGTDYARAVVSGDWEGYNADMAGVGFGQPIERRCRSIFEAGPYQVTFVVEEDRVRDIRADFGISIGNFREGIRLNKQDCPEK